MREPGYLKLVSTRFFTGKDSDCSFGAAYKIKGDRESWVLGKVGSGKLWGSMWQERLDSLGWHRTQDTYLALIFIFGPLEDSCSISPAWLICSLWSPAHDSPESGEEGYNDKEGAER